MHIQPRHLRRGDNLLLTVEDDAGVAIIYGEGRGCTLDVLGGASGVWIPLRGALQIQNSNLTRALHAKEVAVTEHDFRIKATGRGNSRWLAILGGRRTWRFLLADTPAEDAQLLPEKYRASHEFWRKAIALVRSTSSGIDPERILYALADAIASLQSPLHAAITRCPGRTYARKRQVFLRLQRVRNFISTCCDREIDNTRLARMANYSPTHFIRTFNEVFLETPHTYLVGQRLLRAEFLLHSGDFAVREVALASGFENRSAFSRLFRRHFGTTANEARRHFCAAAVTNPATPFPNLRNART